jgi:HEAT repeat protein
MRTFVSIALLLALVAATAGKDGDDVPAADRDLLDIFRKRTISDDDRARIAALLRQLDDDEFETREAAQEKLIQFGRKAFPALRKAAESASQEVRSRAQRCLAKTQDDLDIEKLRIALEVLKVNRPPGTIAALLGYLPDADDEQIQQEILHTLFALSARGGPELKAFAPALRDPNPLRRQVAVTCLARSPSADDRAPVRKLFDDADPSVRCHAAESLLRGGDASGVPTLLALLEEGPADLALSVEEVLQSLAGPSVTNEPLDVDRKEARQKCRAAWETWWKANQDKIDLARWSARPPLLGLTVICEAADPEGVSRVWECARNGTLRWKIPVRNPICVEVMPQGRLLVADCVREGQVVEYDRQGRVLWSYRVASPVSCQRLPNGNTFIATQTHLLEVSRAGRQVLNLRFAKHVHWSRVMPNGNIAYLHSNGLLCVITKEGKQLKAIHAGDVRAWGSFEILGDNHFLVCQYSANKVVELDGDGKVLWSVQVRGPTCAVRVPGGHTLVSAGEQHRVIEFNADGKKVWEQETQGRPYGIVRR